MKRGLGKVLFMAFFLYFTAGFMAGCAVVDPYGNVYSTAVPDVSVGVGVGVSPAQYAYVCGHCGYLHLYGEYCSYYPRASIYVIEYHDYDYYKKYHRHRHNHNHHRDHGRHDDRGRYDNQGHHGGKSGYHDDGSSGKGNYRRQERIIEDKTITRKQVIEQQRGGTKRRVEIETQRPNWNPQERREALREKRNNRREGLKYQYQERYTP